MQLKKNIGLFGGTFDPPHNAHLDLAAYAAKKLNLQTVYFIPSAQHPIKENSKITPVEIRFQMLQAAIANRQLFRISRIEIDRTEVSYTIDTLNQFHQYENIPDAQLYFILGMDNINEIHLWKDPERIFQLATVVVLRRPGADHKNNIGKYGQKIHILDTPLMDISSSAIRAKIKADRQVEEYLPPGVMDIIRKYNLYI